MIQNEIRAIADPAKLDEFLLDNVARLVLTYGEEQFGDGYAQHEREMKALMDELFKR